jgi:hypothetical protein
VRVVLLPPAAVDLARVVADVALGPPYMVDQGTDDGGGKIMTLTTRSPQIVRCATGVADQAGEPLCAFQKILVAQIDLVEVL